MNWQKIDEKLIKRGELVIDTDLLKHHEELKTANQGKNWRPFRMAASYVHLLTAVRYLYQMPYRQLARVTTQPTLKHTPPHPKTHPNPTTTPKTTHPTSRNYLLPVEIQGSRHSSTAKRTQLHQIKERQLNTILTLTRGRDVTSICPT